MKRFVISDIHGGYKALLEVFAKSNIDYQNDKLICLGDVCDGWPDIKDCFEELLKFKNLIYIIGNHDEWTRMFYKNHIEDLMWYHQGGHSTQNAFGKQMPNKILNLLENALNYYIEDNILFVHGGYDPRNPIEYQPKKDLIWNRDLFFNAYYERAFRGREDNIGIYSKIFIGHTPTINFKDKTTPMKIANIINIDTGASYDGPLTIMNIDTEEYWQSKPVCEYYSGYKSRGVYKTLK